MKSLDGYTRSARCKSIDVLHREIFRRQTNVTPWPNLERFGGDYGGWVIPSDLLHPDSVCYLIGVGLDVDFDVALMGRYGCQIYACDPSPRSAQFVAKTILNPLYHFSPVGLSDHDGLEIFYAPDSPEGVSMRSYGTKVQGEFEVRSMKSLMNQFGHDHVDFVKLCCEGFDYQILDQMLKDSIEPPTLCIEFAKNTWEKAIGVYHKLDSLGYKMVHTQLLIGNDWKATFVR